MDLRKALLLTLATTPLSGCYLHCRSIPEERFMMQRVLSRAQLDEIVAKYSAVGVSESAETLTCNQICDTIYEQQRGWQVSNIGLCDMRQPEPSAGFPDGTLLVDCRGYGVEYICKGRRPLGYLEPRWSAHANELGVTLAETAELEQASVLAFEQLAAQLSMHGAPDSLIDRCFAAADDERNHARWFRRLAERHGAHVRSPQVEPHPSDLLALALHNATEGCVHESFAALVAAVIAEASPIESFRRVHERVAIDEAAHGQLAWDLHAWLCDRLPRAVAERVEAARREALRELPERVGWLSALPREFGRYTQGEGRRLARDFADAVA